MKTLQELEWQEKELKLILNDIPSHHKRQREEVQEMLNQVKKEKENLQTKNQ
ncbi:MAG: hypothetical protein IE931_05685 [Sphingobacteriales bacterium]|nr:hypothetical protein [Sphingobacteriales bacterium]